MKLNFDFETKMEFDVCVEVEGFTPSRPAPSCSNHDSPVYSDSGDDPDFDMYTCFFIFKHNGKQFKMEFPEELYNILEDKIQDEILQHGSEKSNDCMYDSTEKYLKNDVHDRQ